jgi:dihydroxyacetone kinase phosphoprotein-dependent L subunit
MISDMESLTTDQVKAMFLHVADVVVAAKEQLCDADRNIGDGDHGIGMALGFEAAGKELETHEYTDVYAVFAAVGRTMIRVMGGASGIIFGLLFYAGAKNKPPRPSLTTAEFAEIFNQALAEIQAKGQAKLGDKTLVDGLQPMVEAMQASAAGGDGFKAMLNKAALAAEDGKEKSKQYVAHIGKAKTLGDRAVGFPDAGCVTLTVISSAMSEWMDKNLPD